MYTRSLLAILVSASIVVAVGACSSDSEDGAAAGSAGSSGTAGSSGEAGQAGAAGATTSCIDGIAVYSGNSTTGTATDPGTKQPNAFGLYDMLGNAIEWVQDCYHENYTSAPADGTAWVEDGCEYRVIRGGCYGSTARGLRVSMRDGAKPNFYGACAPGVRCVRTSSEKPSTALIDMDWVKIPAGTFTMGCSTGDDNCYDNEKEPHSVSVGAFEMTSKEATQQEFFDQMGFVNNPSMVCKTCAELYVNWDNAAAFCQALGGRLPTEAEWEYAARGGTTTRYYCGND